MGHKGQDQGGGGHRLSEFQALHSLFLKAPFTLDVFPWEIIIPAPE